MQYLLLTRDARLVQLARRALLPHTLQHAPDTAAVLRQDGPCDAALLDGGLPPPDRDDFLRWWRAGPGVGRRLFHIEPRDVQLHDALRVPREVDALRRAAAHAARLQLDTAAGALRVADGPSIPLTPSELAILHALAHHQAGLSAREIMAGALGYHPPEPTALVRTHVANIRRKCRRHGVGEVVQTRGRRYHAPDLTLGPDALP